MHFHMIVPGMVQFSFAYQKTWTYDTKIDMAKPINSVLSRKKERLQQSH